jgi:hypothetical protein
VMEKGINNSLIETSFRPTGSRSIWLRPRPVFHRQVIHLFFNIWGYRQSGSDPESCCCKKSFWYVTNFSSICDDERNDLHKRKRTAVTFAADWKFNYRLSSNRNPVLSYRLFSYPPTVSLAAGHSVPGQDFVRDENFTNEEYSTIREFKVRGSPEKEKYLARTLNRIRIQLFPVSSFQMVDNPYKPFNIK